MLTLSSLINSLKDKLTPTWKKKLSNSLASLLAQGEQVYVRRFEDVLFLQGYEHDLLEHVICPVITDRRIFTLTQDRVFEYDLLRPEERIAWAQYRDGYPMGYYLLTDQRIMEIEIRAGERSPENLFYECRSIEIQEIEAVDIIAMYPNKWSPVYLYIELKLNTSDDPVVLYFPIYDEIEEKAKQISVYAKAHFCKPTLLKGNNEVFLFPKEELMFPSLCHSCGKKQQSYKYAKLKRSDRKLSLWEQNKSWPVVSVGSQSSEFEIPYCEKCWKLRGVKRAVKLIWDSGTNVILRFKNPAVARSFVEIN